MDLLAEILGRYFNVKVTFGEYEHTATLIGDHGYTEEFTFENIVDGSTQVVIHGSLLVRDLASEEPELEAAKYIANEIINDGVLGIKPKFKYYGISYDDLEIDEFENNLKRLMIVAERGGIEREPFFSKLKDTWKIFRKNALETSQEFGEFGFFENFKSFISK